MSGNGEGIKGQLWVAVTSPKPDKTTLNFEDFLVWSKTIMHRELIIPDREAFLVISDRESETSNLISQTVKK